MKYTITLIREFSRNTGEHNLVLITEDKTLLLNSVASLELMFKNNGTHIRTFKEKLKDYTHYYISYSFTKGDN